MRSVHKRIAARRLLAAAAAGAILMGVGTAYADHAHAGPGGAQCQTDLWGFLASQRRTLCDTPKRTNGEWTRARVIWTPAHQVPFTCSYSRYFSSCSGGYFVEQSTQSKETYAVTDDTVLPDEPGHLTGV